jgi:hypothetical protein
LFCALITTIALILSTPAFATTNAAFVQKAIEDLLLRPASPSDVSTFTPLLDSATLTRPQFALGVMNSDEYRHVRVNEFYNDFLGRTPSAIELNNFTTLLQSATLPQGRAAILGSPEYFSLNGSANNSFLNALYLDLLNRSIDPTALSAYNTLLTGGATRTDVALNVQTSDEWRGDIVNAYYQQFLHRPADPTGLAQFKNLLSIGGTEQDVIANLIGSPEYFNNVPEPAALALLCLVPLAITHRRR